MHTSPDTNPRRSELYATAASMLAMMRCPAVIVRESEHVVVCNSGWSALTGCDPASTGPVALEECVHDLTGGAELVAAIRSNSGAAGALVVSGSRRASSLGSSAPNEYAAMWGRVRDASGSDTYTVVVLEPMDRTPDLVSVIRAQRTTIDRLLVRQALIEEGERRCIGRAMHDDIVQELARLRARLAVECSGDGIVGVRSDLDAVIDRVRKMMFELSPPILEDLGLLPALRWLAEHMGDRYGMRVEVAEDAVNPPVAINTRTIAFRAVRELVINAAKHAPDADVLLTCECDAMVARIKVRDTGPGFDVPAINAMSPGFKHFGLLSLEQEVRGVGGSFELVSAIGAGTRATITVPLAFVGKALHA